MVEIPLDGKTENDLKNHKTETQAGSRSFLLINIDFLKIKKNK
jgi:hypothetical protein